MKKEDLLAMVGQRIEDVEFDENIFPISAHIRIQNGHSYKVLILEPDM